MQPLFLSWKKFLSWTKIVSVGAALALLLSLGPTSSSPALAGVRGAVGVGVGIGVASILLNEAIRRSQERRQAAEPDEIRRSQERRQAAEPEGCPPGLVPSRKGCVKPGKNRGLEVTKCEPPMQWRKGKGCVSPKAPEVAKCEAPMKMRKGRCVMPEPEVAKCEHPNVYRKGKGCVPPDRGPETASCDRPFIKVGKGCACPPGLIQSGHYCRPPTIVVVPPSVVPAGPGPEEPPHVVPAATPPAAPPSLQQASPVPEAPLPRPSAFPSGKRVALVIGNSNYRSVARLANPANDAKLMANALKSLGFELIGGGAQLDLDKAGFDAAVQSFGNRLQGADVGLFYYAGHGLGLRGTNYLVPVNANPTREADVDFQMVDIEVALHQMETSGTKLNVVMLDACRNNPFAGRGLRASSGGLAQMQAPEGTLISYATQPNSVAQDGIDGNSPYSKALAETIRTPGLDIFQSFNRVGVVVKNATGGSQQPWISISPIEGEFFFAGR